MARALRVDRSVQVMCKPERLFKAVSETQELARWFADRVTGDIEEGGLVEFTWGQGGMAHSAKARVLRLQPGKSVMLRWEDARSHSRDDYMSLTVKEGRSGSTITVIDFATKDTQDELEEIWDQCLARLKEALE